jgi:hypothetical protein
MKKLFSAVEAIDNLDGLEMERLVLSEGELERVNILMAELDQDITKDFENLDVLFDKIDEAQATIEHLENIAMVISEHGICQATMEAVDPYGELVAAGLVASYELLAVAPTKDEYAEKAVEGIMDAVKGFFSKIGAFFTKIMDFFRDIAANWKKNTMFIDAEFGDIRKKLKLISSFDEEKFAKKRVRSYPKSDFQKIFSAFDKLIAAAKSGLVLKTLHDVESSISGKNFDKDAVKALNDKIAANFKPLANPIYKEAFGFYIVVGDDGRVSFVTKTKETLLDVRDTMDKLGWKASDAEPVASKCFNTVAGLTMLGVLIHQCYKSSNSVHKLFASARNMFEGMSADEKAGFKYLLSSSQQNYRLLATLFRLTFTAQRSIFYTGATVGRTAIKCGKK